MTSRFIVRGLLGLALLASSSQLAFSQVPGSAGLPQSTISAFLANPGALLTQPGNANGGRGLTSQVRNLLTADQSTLSALVALLKDATPDQRRAIAAGLAEAAKIYARTNPGEATQIQQAVAATGLADVILAYSSAGGDTTTASIGGGGGGSGSGGPTGSGGPFAGGGGFAAPFGTNFAGNTSGNLLTGGSTGSGGIIAATSPH